MQISKIKSIKRSRKQYRCSWCYEIIESRSPYKSWFTFGEAVTTRMHPECYEAHLKVDLRDDDCLPTPGTFRRGCWCEEIKELCQCGEKNNEPARNQKKIG